MCISYTTHYTFGKNKNAIWAVLIGAIFQDQHRDRRSRRDSRYHRVRSPSAVPPIPKSESPGLDGRGGSRGFFSGISNPREKRPAAVRQMDFSGSFRDFWAVSVPFTLPTSKPKALADALCFPGLRQPPPQQFCAVKGRHVREPGFPRSRPFRKIDINADASFSAVRETKRDIAYEHPVGAHASQQIHGVKTNAVGRIVANVQCNAVGSARPARAHDGDRCAADLPERSRNQGCHGNQQKRQRCANN